MFEKIDKFLDKYKDDKKALTYIVDNALKFKKTLDKKAKNDKLPKDFKNKVTNKFGNIYDELLTNLTFEYKYISDAEDGYIVKSSSVIAKINSFVLKMEQKGNKQCDDVSLTDYVNECKFENKKYNLFDVSEDGSYYDKSYGMTIYVVQLKSLVIDMHNCVTDEFIAFYKFLIEYCNDLLFCSYDIDYEEDRDE